MPDGDGATPRAHGANEAFAAGQFRRDGHEQNGTRQQPVEALQEPDVGRPHRVLRVAAGIALARVQKRPFEMVARDHRGSEAASSQRSVER
jgi:hypothetical protein